MNINKLYLINENDFTAAIQNWAIGASFEHIEPANLNNMLEESIDGAVVFHVNHNFNKEIVDKLKLLENHNLSLHKVDINGTIAATVSNLEMWLDRNRPKNVLVMGCNDVAKSDNLNKFLLNLLKKLKG